MANAANGDGAALMMDASTSFVGTSEDVPVDAKTINRVASIPVHY